MSNKSSFSWELFDQAPIVGILRGLSKATIHKITEIYLEAGLSTIEVTMNTEGAKEIIAALRNDFPHINVGAGTVCTMKDLETALEAGSQFIVTPIIDEKVIKASVSKGIPTFPGAYTPTEIYKAWSLGASAVKVFPASQLGTTYIKDVLAPLDKIKLLPTGGIDLENIKSFFESGAFGVGMGSSLFHKKHIQEKDWEQLKRHFIDIKSEIQVRGKK